MGRAGKKGKRGGGRGGGPNGRKERNPDERTDLIEQADMENERFFAYYKAQRIVPDEEWDDFVAALRRHLPTTFRVAGSRLIATTLNTMIKELHVPNLSNVVFEGEQVPPPVQLSWYPDGLAWQFNVPKKVLRKSPEFKKFHSFLVFETEVGNISRQEAVSMLPPLFLEVEPHHKCMDMCAAPGSKTAQILEALHAADTSTTSSTPSGLLIANDSDNKRTHLLIHQSARLPSPALMVTNLDASGYPGIKVPARLNQDTATAFSATGPPGEKLETLLFDRILCDVPCSGDGTIRKNMGIWKSWAPMDGNGLHALQLRILQRAMNMLKNTGRIVYSTCSLNPVENEAVVAAALLANKDFHLVDVSSKLPTLIRRPGLTTWRPTSDRSAARTFESYEEFMSSDVEEHIKAKMSRGQWPPDDDVVKDLNLERCMRIYPHLQDTGGFFVAVLEKKPKTKKTAAGTAVPLDSAMSTSSDKKRELTEDVEEGLPESKRAKLDEGATTPQQTDEVAAPTNGTPTETVTEDAIAIDASPDPADAAMDDAASASASPPAIAFEDADAPQPSGPTIYISKKLARGEGGFKENPYTFLSPSDPILVSCLERLHISAFPTSNVLVRNPSGAAARSLYLANDLVRAVITHNSYERLRLTAAGTKVFAKQEGGTAKAAAEAGTAVPEAQFRVLGEGLPVVLPYVDETTIIPGDMATLRTLVEAYYPLCSTFEEPFRGVIEARGSGSHIIRFPLGNLDGASLTHELVLPIWKSNVSVTLMIDKKAKSALSLRLFGADITTAGKQAQAQKEKSVDVEK